MSSGCWDPLSCGEQLCSSPRLFSWKHWERCEDALRYLCFRMEMEPAILIQVFSHPERHDFWGQFGPGAASSISFRTPIRGCSTSVCRVCPRADSASGAAAPWEAPAGLRGQVQCLHTSSHGDATAWPMAPQDQQGPHIAFWGSATTPGHQTLALKEGPTRPPSLPKCPFCGTPVSPQGQEAGRPLSRGSHPAVQGSSSTEHPSQHHLPVHSLALHWDPPALPQACTKRARAPPAWLPPGAPRRYRVTCFDCLTCNC